MARVPGGYIGIRPAAPTTSSAVGVWSLGDHYWYKRNGTWPAPDIDPSFANVSLLLHMNGTNGSTTFTDSSVTPKTVTPSSTEISTTQSKFGGASASFTGGHLAISDSSGFGFGTGDFTVEFWLYYTGGNGYVFFWNNNPGFGLYIGYGLNNNTKQPWLWDGGNVLTTSTAVTDNAWQHHAVVRSGGDISIYLDGTLLNSGAFTNDLGTSRPFRIGDNGQGSQATSGYIDEFRVTKGVARYTSAFDPPTAPFQDA